MQIWTWLLGVLLFLISASSMAAENALLLQINDPIGPAVQDYITRGIHQAEYMNAAVVIIELNTFGGLETSMHAIDDAIIASSVPVVAFITPSGAHAANEATFIMFASHFAIMTPGTHIGGATPVKITPEETLNPKLLDSDETEAMKDAVTYLRSLALLHGRNAEWAEVAVTKASSISAEEALRINVINNIATTIPQLLQEVDGKKTMVMNQTKIMSTKNLKLQIITPDFRNRFLYCITDPNIAYMLLLIALYGLFYEFTNPGLILPGITGIAALVLALYAFQFLPINYIGLSLIISGIIFMVFEVYISNYGIIGLGGIIAFVIGSILLYDTYDPDFRVDTTLILGMTTITCAFFMMITMKMIRTRNKLIRSGHKK